MLNEALGVGGLGGGGGGGGGVSSLIILLLITYSFYITITEAKKCICIPWN